MVKATSQLNNCANFKLNAISGHFVKLNVSQSSRLHTYIHVNASSKTCQQMHVYTDTIHTINASYATQHTVCTSASSSHSSFSGSTSTCPQALSSTGQLPFRTEACSTYWWCCGVGVRHENNLHFPLHASTFHASSTYSMQQHSGSACCSCVCIGQNVATYVHKKTGM